jgi:hypothetical protein
MERERGIERQGGRDRDVKFTQKPKNVSTIMMDSLQS